MRVAFLGTGAFAVPSLEALAEHHEVALVVSQPDREQGRGRQLAAPPVKVRAVQLGLAVEQPRRIREPEAVDRLRSARPEALVVVAYGQILPPAVLELAPRGAINVHGSLLPRWRGAAPIQWAIAEGDPETGVTTMLLDEGLDTGPILLQRPERLAGDETAASLSARLAPLGAGLLIETLDGLAKGGIRPRPQDPARATHARLLSKDDGRVEWTLGGEAIERRVRAFTPWPGAFFFLGQTRVRLVRAQAAPPQGGEPGAVVAVGQDGILVSCGARPGARLLEVQPESRRSMSAAAMAAGHRLAPGQKLG
jgi:methionyl-tRNA formyltransferase